MVGDPAIRALGQKNRDEFEAAQIALLGAAGYQRSTEYGRSMVARSAVDRLAGAATLAGDPLSVSQAEQLTLALAQASPGYRTGGSASLFATEWAAADAEASRILSSPQFALYLTVASTRRGWSRSEVLFENAALDAVNRPPTPAQPGTRK